ncbi:MAG TPA: hypothetical protein VIC85_05545 [Ktedonobacterales bacterium]|jgi:DNA-binding transcriptional ArsR family regulator
MRQNEMDRSSATITTAELARRLMTSAPRVRRAAHAGIIAPVGRDARGRPLFTSKAEDALRARWGVAPPAAELSRTERFVLAALVRHPFGLRSARAVARVAGVSPTAASHALAALRDRRLVRQRRLVVAEGRAREVENWSIAWREPAWWRVAPDIDRVDLPAPVRRPRAAGPPRRLPRRLWHLFWDVNPASVDLRRHAEYVAARVLAYGDRRAVGWLVRTVPPEALRAVGRGPGRVSPEVRRLARALAGDSRAGDDDQFGHEKAREVPASEAQ